MYSYHERSTNLLSGRQYPGVSRICALGYFSTVVRGSDQPPTTYFSSPLTRYCVATKKLFSLCKANQPKQRACAFFQTLSYLSSLRYFKTLLSGLSASHPALSHPSSGCCQTANTSLIMISSCLEPKDSLSLWGKIQTYFSKYMGF